MRHFWWIIGLLICAAACTPENAAVPTLMVIPTATITPAPVADGQSVFDNLPATFTPTSTFTPTATFTTAPTTTGIPTLTFVPSATITNTPSPTGTDIPTVDPANRPLLALLLTQAANATVLPDNFVVPPFQGIDVTLPPTALGTGAPTGIPPLEAITSTPGLNSGTPGTTTCPIVPAGGFGAAFLNNPTTAAQLGCPTGTAQDVPAAWESFQQGIMVWLNGEMLVLYNTRQFQTYPDTFVEGVDPQTSSETPPQGLFTPIRGFLKVWSGNPAVRNGLGWALNAEQGVTAKVQTFPTGRMIWLPGRGEIIVLLSGGQWQSFPGSF
jgi:hypothetical protein